MHFPNSLFQKLTYLLLILISLLNQVSPCKLGPLPAADVKLFTDKLITYQGCESDDGKNVENYHIHAITASVNQTIEINIVPYDINQQYRKNAKILLSSINPVIWSIKTIMIHYESNIAIYTDNTSSVLSTSPEITTYFLAQINSDSFAESLRLSYTILGNITMGAVITNSNYIQLELGRNPHFYLEYATLICEDMILYGNLTNILSQRLKVYNRDRLAGSDAKGCINRVSNQSGERMKIGIYLQNEPPSTQTSLFTWMLASKPELNLIFTAEELIEQEAIKLALISNYPVKWNIFYFGFNEIIFNIKRSEDSEIKIHPPSQDSTISTLTSFTSGQPATVLTELQEYYNDDLNVFVTSPLVSEINIHIAKVSDLEPRNFDSFLAEITSFEYCSQQIYIVCFLTSILEEIEYNSYNLTLSNKPKCVTAFSEETPCYVERSDFNFSQPWTCYEVKSTHNTNKITHYFIQVTINLYPSDVRNKSSKDSNISSNRQENENNNLLNLLYYYRYSYGGLECTNNILLPVLFPSGLKLSTSVNNLNIKQDPLIILPGSSFKFKVTFENVSNGMIPVLQSCHLSYREKPVDNYQNQDIYVQLIDKSCPTTDGLSFNLTSTSLYSLINEEHAIELTILHSLQPFLSNKAILIENSFLHCYLSQCQVSNILNNNYNIKTGYPLCKDLNTLCRKDTREYKLMYPLFLNESLPISTGRIAFNTPFTISTTVDKTYRITTNNDNWTLSTTSKTAGTPLQMCSFTNALLMTWPLLLVLLVSLPVFFCAGGIMFQAARICAGKNSTHQKLNEKPRVITKSFS